MVHLHGLVSRCLLFTCTSLTCGQKASFHFHNICYLYANLLLYFGNDSWMHSLSKTVLLSCGMAMMYLLGWKRYKVPMCLFDIVWLMTELVLVLPVTAPCLTLTLFCFYIFLVILGIQGTACTFFVHVHLTPNFSATLQSQLFQFWVGRGGSFV